MKSDFEKLVNLYPVLNGRDDPNCKPKYKIVVRMLDRCINLALNNKPGIKIDRKEELTVAIHTAGQNTIWTIPIVAALEDKEIMANLSQKEAEALAFVFNYDTSSE